MAPIRRPLDFRGALQTEVMAAVWRLGEATVEEVRALQPGRRRPAYTTVQTVLNRLVESGALTRSMRGRAYVYRARYDQVEYLTLAIGDRLGKASPEARRSVLMNVVDGLAPEELDELARHANRIRRERRARDDD